MSNLKKLLKSNCLAVALSLSTVGQTNAQGVESIISFGGFVLDSMSTQSDPTASIVLENFNLLTELSRRIDGVENGILALYTEIGASENRIKGFVTDSFNSNDVKALISVSQAYLSEIQQLEQERMSLSASNQSVDEVSARIIDISQNTAFEISQLRQKVSLGTYLSAPTVAATASVEIFARLKAGQGDSLGLVFDGIDQYFDNALNPNIENSVSSEILAVQETRNVWIERVQGRLGADAINEGFYGRYCTFYATHQRWSSSSKNPSAGRTLFHTGIELFVDRVDIANSSLQFISIPQYPSIRVTAFTADNWETSCVDGGTPVENSGLRLHELPPFSDYPQIISEVEETNLTTDALYTLLALEQQVVDLRLRFQSMKSFHVDGRLFADSMTRDISLSTGSLFNQHLMTISLMQRMEAGQSRVGLSSLMSEYRIAQDISRRTIAASEISVANAISNASEPNNILAARQLLSYLSYAVRLKQIISVPSLVNGDATTAIVDNSGTAVAASPSVDVENHTSVDGLEVISGSDAIAQGYDNPLREIEVALAEYDALGDPEQPTGAEWTAHERKLDEIFRLASGTLHYNNDNNASISAPYASADDIFRPSLQKSIGVFFSILFDPVVLGDAMVDWRSEIDALNNGIASRTDALFRLRDPDGKISSAIGGLPSHLNDPVLFKCLSEPCWQAE